MARKAISGRESLAVLAEGGVLDLTFLTLMPCPPKGLRDSAQGFNQVETLG